MKKLLILVLALCLCPLAAWAEPAAQMEYDSHFIEEMFAANTREAVLARHESVNITIERYYLYNFSIIWTGAASYTRPRPETITA